MTDLPTFLLARYDEDEQTARRLGTFDWPHGFSSARILTECEAQRRIVELFTSTARRHQCSTDELFFGDTLRLLALPYAAHPDFQEEWHP